MTNPSLLEHAHDAAEAILRYADDDQGQPNPNVEAYAAFYVRGDVLGYKGESQKTSYYPQHPLYDGEQGTSFKEDVRALAKAFLELEQREHDRYEDDRSRD